MLSTDLLASRHREILDALLTRAPRRVSACAEKPPLPLWWHKTRESGDRLARDARPSRSQGTLKPSLRQFQQLIRIAVQGISAVEAALAFGVGLPFPDQPQSSALTLARVVTLSLVLQEKVWPDPGSRDSSLRKSLSPLSR